MISAVRRLKDAPSEAKCQKIAETLDQDHDGSLDLGDLEMVSDKCDDYMYKCKCYNSRVLRLLHLLPDKSRHRAQSVT